MIRFACPGCQAVYEVGDDRGGKSGKCPKCEATFTVPPAYDPAAPPPLPPPAPPSSVEVAPCPGCQARLSVSAADLGANVECPHCGRVFRADPDGPAPRPADDRPSRRRRDPADDDFDDPRPRRRSRRGYRPSEVGAIGGFLLGGGIYALVYAAASVLLSSCICLVWPGLYLGIVWGILAIIQGSAILNRTDVGDPPRTLAVLQIVLIINGDVVNLILGILGLVFMSNPAVRDYYEGGRRD